MRVGDAGDGAEDDEGDAVGDVGDGVEGDVAGDEVCGAGDAVGGAGDGADDAEAAASGGQLPWCGSSNVVRNSRCRRTVHKVARGVEAFLEKKGK